MSTAQDLPARYGDPPAGPAGPALRLVAESPLDFDEAVRRVRPRLHRYAVRRLGDLHEAEELVQEALLRAYSHRHQLLTEDDLAAWTTVVTGRLVIDRLRVRGRSTSVAEMPEALRTSRDTAEVVVARDEARMALDALDAMHPRQAALLWAREVEGQSYDDLCARFGMSEPAVRSVLTRARKALRKEYAARGGTLPVGGLAVLAPWVAGLGWAGRLRRAATRLTAPAALSAVGITALGGLVLHPFTFGTPGQPGFHPSIAVVATPGLDPVLHPLVPAPAGAAASSQLPAPHTANRPTGLLARTLRAPFSMTPCVNGSDSEDRHRSVSPPVSGVGSVGLGAGSSSCDQPRSVRGNTVYVAEPADGPLSGVSPSVTSDVVDCTLLPDNPTLKCNHRETRTQPGDTK